MRKTESKSLECFLEKYWLHAVGVIVIFSLFNRLFQLHINPPGLYWEEVALGYDAYSIWETGADHHGNPFPLVAFESFGDWKPSLYFYAASPFVGLIGLSAWAVRLPSVIAGILIVIGVGVLSNLVWQLLGNKPSKRLLILGMFVAAINPWALHFSRGGWEANLATALILWGIIMGLTFWIKKSWKWLVVSSVLLILSMYAYHAARIISPMLGLSLLLGGMLINKGKIKELLNQKLQLVVLLLISFVLLIPFFQAFTSNQITQRFAETSIFSDIEIIIQSNRYIELTGGGLLSRLLFHRFWFFLKEIGINFFKHLNFDFLFVQGDANLRHSVQYFGHFYYVDFIFLLSGVYFFIKQKHKVITFFLLWWLIIGIFPASITFAAPHALRILPVMPLFLTVIALGIMNLFLSLRKSKVLANSGSSFAIFATATLMATYLFFFSWYWHYYFTFYPQFSADSWQADYPQLINQVEQLQQENPNSTIYVSREWGRPAMFYWFYTKTDPREVQAQAQASKKDQSEFLEFNNIRFDSSAFTKADIMVKVN